MKTDRQPLKADCGVGTGAAVGHHRKEWLYMLEPKDVTCSCGHVTHLANRKLLCIKCGKYVFYSEEERKAHRRLTLYVTIVLALALGFVAYFFVEMVLGPLRLLME